MVTANGGVQAAIGPNLRFGKPMCVPVVLLFGLSDGLKSSLHFQVASLSYISRNTSVSQSNTFNTRPEVTVRCGR